MSASPAQVHRTSSWGPGRLRLSQVTAIADRALRLLRQLKTVDPRTGESVPVLLRPGLSDKQLIQIEERFGFQFNPDHAALLRMAAPAWIDWLGNEREIRRALDWPAEGLLWDIKDGSYWHEPWGKRPDSTSDAIAVARDQLSRAPVLVPVYGHRYVPAAPAPSGSPVLSVMQSDIIYYGRDLVDYFRHEFLHRDQVFSHEKIIRVPFWSDVVDANQ